MSWAVLIVVLAVADTPETAADLVTLRDGRVVRGQVVESAARGSTLLVVRRGWVEGNLPEQAQRWRLAEAPALKLARKQRRERLEAWRPERARVADTLDPVLEWIDRERERLARDFDPAEAPLMLVSLARGEVKAVVKRPEASRRMIRQAWIAGLDDPESLELDDLRTALKKAHVPAIGEEPAPIDELLPERAEPDQHWRLRRAATEVSYDAGPRFVRYQGLVLPEGDQAAPADLQGALAGVLGDLLGDRPAVDPLADRLARVAAKGKVGAIVTRLDLGPDVAVEATLWVHNARQGWQPALRRVARVQPGDLPARAGEPLADDPQVKAAFAGLQALGLGQLGDDARRLSLRSGAAAQQAIGEAREALNQALKGFVLPIRSGIRPLPAQGTVPETEPRR